MKTTDYFKFTRDRADRKEIKDERIEKALYFPIREVRQLDGRFKRWTQISDAGDRYLRVIVLEDGKTVHNAFFDRNFKR